MSNVPDVLVKCPECGQEVTPDWLPSHQWAVHRGPKSTVLWGPNVTYNGLLVSPADDPVTTYDTPSCCDFACYEDPGCACEGCGGPETFEDVFDGIFDEAFDLLVAKQRSYGPKNVESLGFFGVFDRLSSDKVERLRNAMQGVVKNGHVEIEFAETLSDESIEDTLKDMLNYSAILIALKRGKWGRPLRDEAAG